METADRAPFFLSGVIRRVKNQQAFLLTIKGDPGRCATGLALPVDDVSPMHRELSDCARVKTIRNLCARCLLRLFSYLFGNDSCAGGRPCPCERRMWRKYGFIAFATLLLAILPACSTVNLGDTVFAAPVKERYTVSSGFGRRKGRPHKGIDLAARKGAPILASAPGRVIFAGAAGSYGKLVKLRHPGRVETWYAHLDRITCKRGDFIAGGGKIGTMGATGRATGPHLHFEIRHRGRPYNPARFIRFRSRR